MLFPSEQRTPNTSQSRRRYSSAPLRAERLMFTGPSAHTTNAVVTTKIRLHYVNRFSVDAILYTSCTHMHGKVTITVCPCWPTKQLKQPGDLVTFDLLTVKVVSESHATSVPILVFLDLSVLDLGPMYATDRQTSDVRQHHRVMPPYCKPCGKPTLLSNRIPIEVERVVKHTYKHTYIRTYSFIERLSAVA